MEKFFSVYSLFLTVYTWHPPLHHQKNFSDQIFNKVPDTTPQNLQEKFFWSSRVAKNCPLLQLIMSGDRKEDYNEWDWRNIMWKIFLFANLCSKFRAVSSIWPDICNIILYCPNNLILRHISYFLAAQHKNNWITLKKIFPKKKSFQNSTYTHHISCIHRKIFPSCPWLSLTTCVHDEKMLARNW